jgi:predicted AlkP superfamily pyrophosphatase or phosphodiesterase
VNVVPALLGDREPSGDWLPADVLAARQVVLLVLDGLGWEQLQERTHLARHLTALDGRAITTVAPTTTATAMTSITTGLTPGEHGLIGYRMSVDGDVLNLLRWTIDGRDARAELPPAKMQPEHAFCDQCPPVVARAEHMTSAFSEAHLENVRFRPYRMISTLAVEVGRLLEAGEPFIYAYYDGIDKVAHEYGLTEYYDAELTVVDTLIGWIRNHLPPGAALVVTADHGQVHVGDNLVELDPSVQSLLTMQSGEARFRWLHARPGAAADLLAAATEAHGDVARVVPTQQMLDEHWFGPTVSDVAQARLGDVALVAHAPIAFVDEADSGPYVLIGRHGSMTAAEVMVPLLSTVA